MAKRVRKVIPQGISREQMEDAFAKYNTADANQQRVTAIMDKRITVIREKHQDELANYELEKAEAFEVIQAYSVENKEVLFSKKKSIETTHGIIGFRTGTPKLKPLRGFTWASITNLVKEFMPDYIRTKDEPMKDKLLADRDSDKVAEQLEKCGISVIQDEAFFVEPKKEEVSA